MITIKKRILFLIVMVCLISCSKDYLFNKHQVEVSKELKSLLNADQAARSYNSLVYKKFGIRDFQTVGDSVMMSGAKDFSGVNLSNLPSLDKQLKKLTPIQKENFYFEVSRGGQLIEYVDKVNKDKFYKIIKKYGYPSFYNREWIDTTLLRVGITSTLTHYDPDSDFGRKLLKLMINEYKKGRVEEGEMQHYLWSADGRSNGYPYEYKFDIKEWEKKVKKFK